MVEPLFKKVFASPAAAGQEIVLDGDEGKHAVAVRRMRVGEAIALTDGRGTLVHGTVSALATKHLSVSAQSVEHVAEPKIQITLVQSLAKSDRDELAIQAATELGASEVIPWQAARSVSRWDATKAQKGQQRWQSICDEAAKQAIRAHFPVVQPMRDTKQLLASLPNDALILVLDPTAASGISSVLESKLASTTAVWLVVGPEGGITESELSEFEHAGAQRVHIGAGILRTSTAGMAAISVINALAGIYRTASEL